MKEPGQHHSRPPRESSNSAALSAAIISLIVFVGGAFLFLGTCIPLGGKDIFSSIDLNYGLILCAIVALFLVIVVAGFIMSKRGGCAPIIVALLAFSGLLLALSRITIST